MAGTKASTLLGCVALCAVAPTLAVHGALAPIALNTEGAAPDWIMLLPVSGGLITTQDGRGPYKVRDAAALAAASLEAAGGRLLIDSDHSTDLAAPEGRPAPARGWVVALEARADGIWGRVEWTEEGRAMVAGKAYRSISPVFAHGKQDTTITRLLRASLTNTPNLRGMAALHSEEVDNMDLKKLRAQLGLSDDADETAITAAIAALKSSTALQSALAPIAKAAGLTDGADAAAIITAVTTLSATAAAAAKPETVAALQAELTTVTGKLNDLLRTGATDRATAFVDAAIKAGRVGVKPLREHYIAQHAIDSARVEKEINAMPILGPSGARIDPPEIKDGKVALSAEQQKVADMLGIKHEDYAKTLAAEQAA